MKQGYVVIGGNYGDEGKGLMTDYLANLYDAKVVARFNGGTQAGHTVCTPDGKRHVFGHLGAGTFLGADTYLSRDFIVNPYLFSRELAKFRERNSVQFKVTAHPKARVTTIYDMLLNSEVERQRGVQRHGSCGLGINETVTRSFAGFSMELHEAKMSSVSLIADMLEIIHQRWVPQRLEELKIKDIATAFNTVSGDILLSNDYRKHAMEIMRGLQELNVADDLQVSGPVIFEGAQGLALDEFFGVFPHVTRSMTGLHNAVVAARDLGLERLRPIYVTRSYSTRHGAGPLAHEGETFTRATIEDTTNVHNEWQGTIRYAPLDLGQLRRLIKVDMLRGQKIADELNIIVERPQLAVTWVDKVENGVIMYDPEGIQHVVKRSELAEFLTWKLDVDVKFLSLGSTRDTVTQVD